MLETSGGATIEAPLSSDGETLCVPETERTDSTVVELRCGDFI